MCYKKNQLGEMQHHCGRTPGEHVNQFPYIFVLGPVLKLKWINVWSKGTGTFSKMMKLNVTHVWTKCWAEKA